MLRLGRRGCGWFGCRNCGDAGTRPILVGCLPRKIRARATRFVGPELSACLAINKHHTEAGGYSGGGAEGSMTPFHS